MNTVTMDSGWYRFAHWNGTPKGVQMETKIKLKIHPLTRHKVTIALRRIGTSIALSGREGYVYNLAARALNLPLVRHTQFYCWGDQLMMGVDGKMTQRPMQWWYGINLSERSENGYYRQIHVSLQHLSDEDTAEWMSVMKAPEAVGHLRSKLFMLDAPLAFGSDSVGLLVPKSVAPDRHRAHGRIVRELLTPLYPLDIECPDELVVEIDENFGDYVPRKESPVQWAQKKLEKLL